MEGIVKEEDLVVIAVNICRLSHFDIDGSGISQLPLALESVFPVGPLSATVAPHGTLAMRHTSRFFVRKNSAKQIETFSFLDPACAGISAILQGHQKDVYQRPLVLSQIHNPLARNRLPTGLFDASTEFVATEDGEFYELRNIAQSR